MSLEFLKYLKPIAIISYISNILKGSMIGIPLGFWLLFSFFDPFSKESLFSIVASLG
jgi:hypothetical protein